MTPRRELQHHQPQSQQPQHYELLKELPPDILERILLQYCDGKSLSTLALVCSTKDSQSTTAAFYHRDVYAMICSVCQSVIQKIRQDIQSGQAVATVVKKKYSSDIQSSRNDTDWLLQWTQDLLNSTGGDVQQGRVLDLSTIQRHGIVKDSEQRQQQWGNAPTLASLCATRMPLRRLSENLAAMDFLRRRGLYYHISTFAPTWDEWSLWAGRIFIEYYDQTATTNGAVNRIHVAANVQMIHCGDSWFDASFPNLALNNRTSSMGVFCVEPASFLPSTPWAQIVGLTPADDECLRHVARLLDDQDEVAILYFTRSTTTGRGTKIFSKRQARRRFDLAPSFFRRRIEPRMLNPRIAATTTVNKDATGKTSCSISSINSNSPTTAAFQIDTGAGEGRLEPFNNPEAVVAAAQVAAAPMSDAEQDVIDEYPLICCWYRQGEVGRTNRRDEDMGRVLDILRKLELQQQRLPLEYSP